jgi:hypothetical protein
MQARGRGREAAAIGDHHECAQQVEVEQRSIHFCTFLESSISFPNACEDF